MSKLPKTPHALTGGGGDHYLFKYPEGGIANSAGKIGKGVDVRGEGGLIVAAPSVHRSGRPYEWDLSPFDVPLADMPPDLAQLIKHTKKSDQPGEHAPNRKGGAGRPATGLQMSRRQQEKVIREAADRVRCAPEGERNDILNRTVFELGHMQVGLDPELVEAEITQAAKESGLDDREIDNTFRSAWNACGASEDDEPEAFDPETVETVEDVFSRVASLARLSRDDLAATRRILKDRFGEALNLRDLNREVAGHQKAHPKAGSLSRISNDYFDTNKGLFWRKETREGPQLVQLTNFVPRIVADISEDDGAEKRRVYEMEAQLSGVTRHFRLSASTFSSMSWVGEQLGATAILFPGLTTRDHARTAIQVLSGEVPEEQVFAHTGWRELPDGTPVYLHAGGALGADGPVEGVQVKLPEELSRFDLPMDDGDLAEGIRATLRILDLVPDAIGVPTLGAAFRAACSSCDFSVFYAGPTGVGKTELAALVQQHFGAEMDSRNLPGSFTSTANSLEAQAFGVKDSVFVVDDFAPTGSSYEVQKLHQLADRLFRGQGNRQGRGRMRPDGTLRPPKYPRGLIVSTGEDVPRGQSLRARMAAIEVSPGSVDFDKLTGAQQDGRSGLYARCMAGFLRYLAKRHPLNHKAEIVKLRDQAAQADAHRRTSDIVANLAYGVRTFLEYATDAGGISRTEHDDLWQRAWAALLEVGRAQIVHQAASEPVQRFLELVTTALASGVAHVATPEGYAPDEAGAWGWRVIDDDDFRPMGKRIGWLDEHDLYLDSEAALAAVHEACRNTGDSLPIGSQTLRKRLAEKNVLRSRDTARETLTVRRRLEGRERNVIHLHASALSPSPETDKPDIPIPDPGKKATGRTRADLRKP